MSNQVPNPAWLSMDRWAVYAVDNRDGLLREQDLHALWTAYREAHQKDTT